MMQKKVAHSKVAHVKPSEKIISKEKEKSPLIQKKKLATAARMTKRK